ncbi:uncharacterized protein PF3D7_1120600 isoform X5 [Hydra vulgaris]|uniref:uncharacterized protein PF3D7_1120600 isoform X5 n=1 Tax=Hydra vulgaris TaxID=6087 RepID=UPI001F5EA9D1|nr:uncharacterized protein PF3D7_1120600 isoform X7 [Hydra vulgaris]
MGKLWKIVEGKWTMEFVESNIESNINYGKVSKYINDVETKSQIKKYTTLNHLHFQDGDSDHFNDINLEIKTNTDDDDFKYGSLDRRLLSQKKKNGLIKDFCNDSLNYKLPENQIMASKYKESLTLEKPVLSRWRKSFEVVNKSTKDTNLKHKVLIKRQPQKSYFDQPSSVKSILQSNGYLSNVDTKNKSQIFLDKEPLKNVKGANKKTNIDIILFQSSEFLNPGDSSFKNSQKANKCNDTLLLKNSSSNKLYKTTLDNKFQDFTFDQSKLINQKKSNKKIVDSISVANYNKDNKVLNSQPDINNNSTFTGSKLEINEMTKKRSNSCPVKFNSQIIGINEENLSASSCIVDSNIDPFDKFEMDNNLALKKEENVGENLKVQTKTQRSNSTGHSPDIKLMLQHLICDIEEEDYISSEEDPSKKSESTSVKSYENFNRNLEGILRLQSIKKKEIDQPLRRTLSNDDVAGKLLRKQRLTRKKIASGEISLKRKPSVIWAKVKNMEVTLVVDCDYQRFMQLKIESFEVRRVNTHKDIEELAVDTFIKHIQLLDKDALDLSSQDIKHLQLHSHEIPIGSVFDIASLNIIDHFLPCFLHLKDKHCWSLAAISYDTLFPKSFLEKYVSLIFVHNYVVFYGPSGTGKSYLARRLSHLVAHRIHENSLPIIYSNISLEKWQKIVQEISCDTSDHSKVYVLDGFTQSFLSSNVDISEILTLPQIMKSKSYVICTCTQGLTDSIPSCWQQSFKWIWLPNHEEPVDCLLQRYLRRKYIQYGNFHLQREFFRIVDWLASAWRHINSIIEKFSSSEYTIGPTMFFPCPSDILNAEEWFVDLWNYSICPYFIQTVRNGIKKYGERTNEWIDPLEMILKTYPWSCEKSKLKFIKIRMEDVGYKNNFQLSETSMTEMERLMTFLRQLELLMSESNDLFPFQEL